MKALAARTIILNMTAIVASFYAMVGRMLDAMGVQLEPEVRNYSPKLP